MPNSLAVFRPGVLRIPFFCRASHEEYGVFVFLPGCEWNVKSSTKYIDKRMQMRYRPLRLYDTRVPMLTQSGDVNSQYLQLHICCALV